MSLIEKLADARIADAYARGELNNLAGAGKPLELDDDSLVPEALRAGFRLLKNAGYLPPEMEARREIADVEQLLSLSQEPQLRSSATRHLSYLIMQLDLRTGRESDLRADEAYYQKLVHRLGKPRHS